MSQRTHTFINSFPSVELTRSRSYLEDKLKNLKEEHFVAMQIGAYDYAHKLFLQKDEIEDMLLALPPEATEPRPSGLSHMKEAV